MIKVGIIGCGKIADLHADAICNISGAEIVGVCDSEELMARQLYERFPVKKYFSNLNRFLEETRPDVVHITTPPQSHYELGMLCLDAGCHIYMEKPFTLNTDEAERLIRFSTEKNLKVTVGHNEQFSHASIRARKLIRDGFLGGEPIHMESIQSYDLGDKSYAKALLGDSHHWVRALPGKLLHNLISHGISKISEFLKSDSPVVIAQGFTSPLLKSINETDIIDELRVLIIDEDRTTAYFTFSSQMGPLMRDFRVYGPVNSIIVDYVQETLIKVYKKNYKSHLRTFLAPRVIAKQYTSNSRENIVKFIKRELNSNSSVRLLTKSFYHSIWENTPLPIPYREILLTSRIMDSIFYQIYPNNRMENIMRS
ncbi:MAG: Gfo/Idh/MocA family protein [Candidatus Kariarchaeaceae archaeon]|jgi:predicted dehydrogenase